MTLPSRKKHRITARRSTKQATANRSLTSKRSLARVLRHGLCIPVGMSLLLSSALGPAIGLAQNPLRSNATNAADSIQNPPAWSPTPFQANPLRETASNSRAFQSNTKHTSARPQEANLASASKPAVNSDSPTNSPTKQSEVLRWRKVDAPAVVARQPAAPVVIAAAFEDQIAKQTPRSSLLVQQPAGPAAVQAPEQPKTPSLPAQETLIPQVPAPSVAQPPALRLPPVIAEPLPEKPIAQPPEPMPDNVLPNPFPKQSATDRQTESLTPETPKDRPSGIRKLKDPTIQEEPSNRQDTAAIDDDLPPAPPKRADQSVANCELVRDFAAGADIRSFQLDSSPDFFQGFQSANRPGSLTKEMFIDKSPSRTWRGTQGEFIAEGKLVDLVYGTVVIEQSDGKRVSYLQRMLSDSDQVFVAESWGVPVTCPLGDQGFAPRLFVDSTFTWKASGACNKPLYFEDVSLERYGHEWGPVVQPVVSTVRFFGDLAVLPYKMGIHPPNECQHPLGYYRPGSCAPWSLKPVPLSLKGAVTQAAFVTGTVFTLP